jgi:hypothetical protein
MGLQKITENDNSSIISNWIKTVEVIGNIYAASCSYRRKWDCWKERCGACGARWRSHRATTAGAGSQKECAYFLLLGEPTLFVVCLLSNKNWSLLSNKKCVIKIFAKLLTVRGQINSQLDLIHLKSRMAFLTQLEQSGLKSRFFNWKLKSTIKLVLVGVQTWLKYWNSWNRHAKLKNWLVYCKS